MTRSSGWNGIEGAPRWIGMFLGAYLLVHLFVLYVWNMAGQAFAIQGTTDSTSAFSVTAMAAVELWLCLAVLRSFPAGAPLRSTWRWIALAAAARAVAGVTAQLFGTDWPLNPLAWTGHATTGFIAQIRHISLIADGPVRLVLLAAALQGVLRVLRKSGFQVRPAAADWAVSGIVCLLALCRFVEAGAASFAGRQIAPETWISLAGLPVLCVLSLEAMLLRHSVARMGNGLIARGWLALALGILLTGAGEAALWVIPHYSQTLPLGMFETLIRLPIAATFALAPAYLLAAQRRAIQPAANQPEDLATGVPALAR